MSFRLDRAATLMLFHPLARATQRPCTSILMYHAVSDQDEPLAPYFVNNTKPAIFRAQMRFLAENGYRVVDLETALRENATDDRRVVITFDDGFRDFYTHAFPVLREFNFTATMFVPTGLIAETRNGVASALCAENFPRPSGERGTKGKGNSASPRSPVESAASPIIHHPSTPRAGRECMTWDEIRELANHGIHFGSHTVSHPKLRNLDWKTIEEELRQSKQRLEQELNREITTFAYPFAYPQADNDFTSRFEFLLKTLGYRCNVTTRIGRAENGDDPYSLRRLPMNSFDDDALLQAKLAGGYDWLAVPQSVTKQVKHFVKREKQPVSTSSAR